MKSKTVGMVLGSIGLGLTTSTTVFKIENTIDDITILDTNFTGKSGQELRRERRKQKRQRKI